MSEPTKEQIYRLQEIEVMLRHVAGLMQPSDGVALRALLDTYEERGREVEQLRAEIQNMKLGFWGSHLRRAEQAEAEVERLRTENSSLRSDVDMARADPLIGELKRELKQAEARLREAVKGLRRIRDGDRECTCDHDTDNCCARVGYYCARCLAVAALAAIQPEEESR